MRNPLVRLGLCAAISLAGPAFGADSQAGALAVSGLSGAERLLTPQEIEALPTVQVTVAVEPGHGPPQRTYEGPLLWTVLDHAGAVDTKFREHVRQAVVLTGSDGYAVVLALGEISPEFAGKQVIVAERQDGQPLGAGHLRLVVPDERRAGRSARDLARISVVAPRSN